MEVEVQMMWPQAKQAKKWPEVPDAERLIGFPSR